MDTFSYYTAQEVYREKYYQMPKVFFTKDKYKQLSNDSKVAYMLLKDRFDYSVQNEWVDKNFNVYFIFTVSELMQLLNCREGKVNKIKKELEAANLLRQERNWVKKTDGTLSATPNRLYLGKPELNSEDVFKIHDIEVNKNSTTNANIANMVEPTDNKDLTINVNFANVAESSVSNDSTINANIANNLFNLKPDTNKPDINKSDTKTSQNLQSELLATFHLSNDQSFLSERSLEFIAMYSKTIQEAHDLVGIILRAKKKAEKDEGKVLIADDWQEEIDLQVIKLVRKLKTDHTIQEPENYWFKTFYYFFQQCCHQLNKADETTPSITVSLHNWLE